MPGGAAISHSSPPSSVADARNACRLLAPEPSKVFTASRRRANAASSRGTAAKASKDQSARLTRS
ncbi:MAG: hypothetical protein A2177_11095 [Spirochaetes bacterium RBG_13_68_11]|nr:MAG: hypothetical protein A2177_11095 [Spirochaetes bacterium RBG_13_68_11]